MVAKVQLTWCLFLALQIVPLSTSNEDGFNQSVRLHSHHRELRSRRAYVVRCCGRRSCQKIKKVRGSYPVTPTSVLSNSPRVPTVTILPIWSPTAISKTTSWPFGSRNPNWPQTWLITWTTVTNTPVLILSTFPTPTYTITFLWSSVKTSFDNRATVFIPFVPKHKQRQKTSKPTIRQKKTTLLEPTSTIKFGVTKRKKSNVTTFSKSTIFLNNTTLSPSTVEVLVTLDDTPTTSPVTIAPPPETVLTLPITLAMSQKTTVILHALSTQDITLTVATQRSLSITSIATTVKVTTALTQLSSTLRTQPITSPPPAAATNATEKLSSTTLFNNITNATYPNIVLNVTNTTIVAPDFNMSTNISFFTTVVVLPGLNTTLTNIIPNQTISMLATTSITLNLTALNISSSSVPNASLPISIAATPLNTSTQPLTTTSLSTNTTTLLTFNISLFTTNSTMPTTTVVLPTSTNITSPATIFTLPTTTTIQSTSTTIQLTTTTPLPTTTTTILPTTTSIPTTTTTLPTTTTTIPTTTTTLPTTTTTIPTTTTTIPTTTTTLPTTTTTIPTTTATLPTTTTTIPTTTTTLPTTTTTTTTTIPTTTTTLPTTTTTIPTTTTTLPTTTTTITTTTTTLPTTTTTIPTTTTTVPTTTTTLPTTTTTLSTTTTTLATTTTTIPTTTTTLPTTTTTIPTTSTTLPTTTTTLPTTTTTLPTTTTTLPTTTTTLPTTTTTLPTTTTTLPTTTTTLPTTTTTLPTTTTTLPTTTTTLPTTTTTLPTTTTTLPTTTTTLPTTTTTLTTAITTTTMPTTTTCIAVCTDQPCELNMNLFTPDGRLKDPSSFGQWYSGCNNQYLFSNALDTPLNAGKACCAIDMELMSIDDAAETSCLSSIIYNMIDVRDRRYWSSGTNAGCDKTGYKWCADNNSSFYPGIPWLSGEPDNLLGIEHCASIEAYANIYPILLSDKSCSLSFNYICEGSLTTTTTCATPTCTDAACLADEYLFDDSGKLLIPPSYGELRLACTKTYFFSAVKLNYCQARKACCRMGMQLLSIEKITELDCLFDYNIGNLNMADWFFTSGRSSTVLSGFTWCPSNLAMDPSLWLTDRPNNNQGAEFAAIFYLDTRQSARNTFDDFNPMYGLRFICEGSVIPVG